MVRCKGVCVSAAVVALLAGCGGGDDGLFDNLDSGNAGLDDSTNNNNDDNDNDGAAQPDADASGAGGGANQVDVSSLGPAPSVAPRAAVLEVEGVTAEYRAVWSTSYTCLVSDSEFEIAMQTMDSNGFVGANQLSISARLDGGSWFGSGAFTHQDHPHTDLYVSQAELTVSGSVVTYRGPMLARDDFGSDPSSRLGVLSIDCGDAFVASASADGTTVEVDINNRSSYGCMYDDTSFEYRAEGGEFPDVARLSIDGRVDGDGWIGTAVMDVGADRYVGVVRGAPDTLDAGPAGVSWSGEATHTSDDDPGLEATVTLSIEIPCE